MQDMPFIPAAAWMERAHMFEAGPYRLATWTEEDREQDRPWILLIHGFPTSSWDWTCLWQGLSAQFNLAAIDMLGFGLSDKPRDIAYSMIQQADFHEAFLGSLDITQAHILAHDYGVSVAQELLARHNEQSLMFDIKSICFLNGGLFPGHHRPRPLQKLALTPLGPIISLLMSKARLQTALAPVFGPNSQPSETEIDGFWYFMQHNHGHRLLHKILHYISERVTLENRWTNALVEAHAPLRLINGALDPVSGQHLYDHYCEIVPHADAILLEEVGHYPQVEAPREVLRYTLEFFSRPSPAIRDELFVAGG